MKYKIMKDYVEHQVKSKFERVVKKVFKIICICILVFLFLLLFGYGFMYLWNWLMPDIFGLKTITYWQAVGILVLAKILFGGFSGRKSGKGKPSRKKCGPGRKMKFKSDFSKWKHYDSFWQEEGEQAYNDFVARKTQENNDTH
ncbi:MAG: hypothetical protein CML05_17980 [Pseudozobellia sp.]|nr:hypothetical protein [Pseudozobellia sp.]